MKKSHFSNKLCMLLFLLFLPLQVLLASTGGGESHSITHQMTTLVLQIGILIFAAKAGGLLMKKINMPSVLGELLVGIIIGPYLLGGISLPGFEHGIFPVAAGEVPVTPELYAFATIASIILLFMTGLETDISLFLRFSVTGSIVGLGGILASFFVGAGATAILFQTDLSDPRCLFLGVLSIATSVGITARILSAHRKMDSPEGVTILAAAVIDDVIGIILLAIVLGVVGVLKGGGGAIDWGGIGEKALKAIGVWLGFTVVGLIFARHISTFLKKFKNKSLFSILALGMALLLAAIFEKAELAMIIGAYVMGLSLSKTDISYVIQEKLHSLQEFFVPIFFTVMGMMVNVRILLSPEILLLGVIFSVVTIMAKIIGCGGPALFLNFNKLGAIRIGLGMVPRGEVSLIIAGTGLAQGILDEKLFGVAILMTLLSSLIAPPLLNLVLGNKAKGSKKDVGEGETVQTLFEFPSAELTDFVTSKVTSAFESEGFFIHRMELEGQVYQIRKDEISVSLHHTDKALDFKTSKEDVGYLKTIVYESLLDIHNAVNKLKDLAKPEEMGKNLVSEESRTQSDIFKQLTVESVVLKLKSTEKEDIIKELVALLEKQGVLRDPDMVLQSVLDREKTMSTGMQYGIALPHGKSDGVDSLKVAIGLKPKGVDFQALDKQPSNIFILVVSPSHATGPHIQFLAAISGILKDEEARKTILSAQTKSDLIKFLVEKSSEKKK